MTNISKLSRLQNKVNEVITNTPMDFSAGPLMKRVGFIKVKELFDYRLCKTLVNERLHKTTTLVYLVNLTLNSHVYNMRSPEKWLVPTSRTNYSTTMLNSIIPTLLNTLMQNDVVIETVTPKTLLEVLL